jgi:two-component system, cell cycle sensor histidine kinase and response regulator CckA
VAHLILVLSSLVAVQYAVIALYVVPRLRRLAGRGEPVLRLGGVGAVLFLLGCAVTHGAIAAHAASGQSATDGWLLLGPLVAQLVGGVVFIVAMGRRIDVRLRTKEQARLEREAERLRERLARSQRLESVGQLAGGVAHDFNNLLAVILNYASFVIDDLDAGDPRREDVVEIRRAAERARDLTHQLLVFSRRDSSLPEVIDVGQALSSAENLLRRTIGAHIELDVDVARGLWKTKLGAGQLEQVLVNLAVNSRDAMEQGGVLSVKARNVHVHERSGLEPGPYVRLVVRDTGSGMPPDVAARAFDPFFTTKPPGKGTGLGLATVYGIATQSGGSVELDSREGAGTAVTLHLPATDDAPVPPALRDGVLRPGDGLRVLVVEDEEAVRALTVRLLREQGYDVVEASDGSEGLERCTENAESLDLLVTDVVMPGMSGPELVASVRERFPSLAALYVSGYAGDLVPGAARVDEGAPVLQKPFSREGLLRAVGDALDERAAAAVS